MKFLNKLLSFVFILALNGCSDKHIKPSSYFANSIENKSSTNASLKNNLLISNAKQFNLTNCKIINHVVSGNILFFINEKGFMSAFDLNAKKTLWSRNILDISSNINEAGLCINDNKIYVTYNKLLLQLNNQGELINYTNLLDISFTNSVIKGDIIYVKTTYHIIAFNKFTLELINKANVKLDANYLFSGDIAKLELLNDNKLLQALSNGMLTISDTHLNSFASIYLPSNNILGIKQNTSAKFQISGFNTDPIIIDSKIYIANNTEGLFCISQDGKLLHNKKIEDIVQMTALNNSIYAISNANQIFALSSDNLNLIWSKDLNLLNKNIANKIPNFETFSNIIIYNNNLIFAAKQSKKIYIVNLEGSNFIKQISKDINQNISFDLIDIKKSINALFIHNGNLYGIDNKALYLLNISKKIN